MWLVHHPDRHMHDARNQARSEQLMVRINVAYQRALELISTHGG